MSINNLYGEKVNLNFQNFLYDFSDKREAKDIIFKNSKNEVVSLEKPHINEGGESRIYKCKNNPNLVVKLFKKSKCSKAKEEKLKTIIDSKLKIEGVCLPTDILYCDDKFIGYLMPKVTGKPLSRMVLGNVDKILNTFNDLDKSKVLDVIIQILNIICELHDNNILVGDIKMENFMVDPKTYKVTLVDFDSVQINGFPCVNTTLGFDAPEIFKYNTKSNILNDIINNAMEYDTTVGGYNYMKYYNDRLRIKEHEYYSVAVLLFKLLMNYDNPFDYKCKYSGEKIVDLNEDDKLKINCQMKLNGEFLYGMTREETYDNVNVIYWSHLPSFIKKRFIEVFKNYRRVSINEWLTVFELYKELIVNNKITDSRFNDVFYDEEADFKYLNIPYYIEYEETGFSLDEVISNLIIKLKSNRLNKYKLDIINSLSNDIGCDYINFKFKLIYNIGILKKVSVRWELD